jgi:autotransporter-associated beta strand protein
MVNHLRGLLKSRFFRALGRVFRAPDGAARRAGLKPRRLALELCEQRQLLTTVGMQIGDGTAGSIGYHQGDAVTIDVAITTNAMQVSSLDLQIDYNPAELSISNGNSNYDFGGDVADLTAGWGQSCNTSAAGQVSVVLDGTGLTPFSSSSVNILALTFHVKSGASAGATPVTFDAGNSSAGGPSNDVYVDGDEPATLAPVSTNIDVLPTGTVDTILIRRDASISSEADLFFNNTGSTPTASPAISALSQPQWSLLGGAGDDQLTVDLSNGDPLPQSSAGGLTYNGGGYVAGNQLVLFDSSPGRDGTWLLGTGQASLADGGALNYANVQTLCLNDTAASATSSNAIPSTTALTLSNGATLNLNSHTEVVGAVSLLSGQISNGTLSSSSADTVSAGTISADLSGTGGLTKNSTGTVTFSGADNYSGGTTVSQGSLVAENSTAIPAGSLLSIGASGSVVLGTPGAVEPLGLGDPGGGPLASSAATVDPSASGDATAQSVTTSDSSTADGLVSGAAAAQNAAAGAGSAATASVDAAAAAPVVLSGASLSGGDSTLSAASIAVAARTVEPAATAAAAPQSLSAIVAPAYQGPWLGCKPQPSAGYVAWQQATDEVLAGGLQATANEAVTQPHDHAPPAALPSLDYSTVEILAAATAKR